MIKFNIKSNKLMKRATVTIRILAIAVIALSAISCKDKQKDTNAEDGHQSEQMEENGHMGDGMEDDSKMDQDNMQSSENMMSTDQHSMKSSKIVGGYLELKNALVADNKEAAAKAGGTMVSSLNDFDASSFPSGQQEELKDIIEDAKEHAEHIEKSPIDHQREHFDVLSKDVIDLIDITGAETTLYQDFCPMYNNKKGAQWLSADKEIKNPYYGSKMMTCGSVQKQID